MPPGFGLDVRGPHYKKQTSELGLTYQNGIGSLNITSSYARPLSPEIKISIAKDADKSVDGIDLDSSGGITFEFRPKLIIILKKF